MKSYLIYAGPFVVGFVETTYTVIEGDNGYSYVDVCVTLISPEGNIGDERVRVEVFHDRDSNNIPIGLALASKLCSLQKQSFMLKTIRVLGEWK